MHDHEPSPTDAEATEPIRLVRALADAIAQSSPADPPRIWAGSVADYLAGTPHGRWISAARDEGLVADDVRTMLARSPTARRTGELPSWGIFAHEGFGRHQPAADARLGEIVRRARRIHEESRAFSAWCALDEGNRTHSQRFFETFQGRFDSLRDWVTLQVEAAGYDQLLDERVPSRLRPFVDIDIDALGHDLETSGSVASVRDVLGGGVWIFTDPGLSSDARKGLPIHADEPM